MSLCKPWVSESAHSVSTRQEQHGVFSENVNDETYLCELNSTTEWAAWMSLQNRMPPVSGSWCNRDGQGCMLTSKDICGF